MAFDPDAYLAEKARNPAPAFDPDAYLASKAPATEESALSKAAGYLFTPRAIMQAAPMAKQLGMGAVKGASNIGATLMAPLDYAANGLGVSNDFIGRHDRRQAVSDVLANAGADDKSGAFQVGKLGAEISGTAPLGGLAGKAVSGLSPALAAAIQSGGFSLGNAATDSMLANAALRIGGGAINGGMTAGAINPSDAPMGAVVGGAIPMVAKVAGEGGKLLRNGASTLLANSLGVTTGAGADAVKTAYQAGKDGSTAFLDNMRGESGFGDVVDAAKDGLSTIRQARQAAYRNGMTDISADKAVLDFAPIDKAMNAVSSMGSYKGVQINKNAASTVNDLKSAIDEWKALDPAEYHTPEGLDALKKSIGDIRDSVQFGTPARKAADQVYNAVKGEITQQAPTYSAVMKGYSDASETITEIEKALSLGNKAAADTSIRKLQSLMRNNAQTSYGNRLSLAKMLEDQGNVDLLPSIAGQAMSAWTPRGMVGAIEKGGAGILALLHPQALAALPLASPRVIGEGAYALGRGVGGVQSAVQPAISNMGNASAGLLDNPELLDALRRTVPLRTTLGLLSAQQ